VPGKRSRSLPRKVEFREEKSFRLLSLKAKRNRNRIFAFPSAEAVEGGKKADVVVLVSREKEAMRKSQRKVYPHSGCACLPFSYFPPPNTNTSASSRRSTTLKLKMKSDDADFPFIFNAKFSLSYAEETVW
jgi:hypothetical protein